MKVVLAGGTGLIGTALTAGLAGSGHEVVVLTRRPVEEVRGLPPGATAARWTAGEPVAAWAGALQGAGAVVNLAGAGVGERPWTAARKRELLDSRVGATSALVAAIAALPEGARPATLVNASGVDYYGEGGDEALDETAPLGHGPFLTGVCERWEAAAAEAEALGVRVVRMRTGLVLARGAMALRLMALPFRLFAGGRTGSGRQWVSWVHMDDVVGLYDLALTDPAVAGPMNVVSPTPVRNAELSAEIGRALHRPNWLPQPAPLLRLALRDQAELLLVGRRLTPAVALARGYTFHYSTVGPALADALG